MLGHYYINDMAIVDAFHWWICRHIIDYSIEAEEAFIAIIND